MPRPSKRKIDREPALISEIRIAIEASGANSYQLASKAGIDEAAVRRFVGRTRSLSLDSAARLAEALGLRVLQPAKPRKFAGRSPTSSVAENLEQPMADWGLVQSEPHPAEIVPVGPDPA